MLQSDYDRCNRRTTTEYVSSFMCVNNTLLTVFYCSGEEKRRICVLFHSLSPSKDVTLSDQPAIGEVLEKTGRGRLESGRRVRG